VNVEFKLKEVGDWIKGYSWKIEEVIFPELDYGSQGGTPDAKNSRRTQDVAAINAAIGKWLAREGLQAPDPFLALGLTETGVTEITPADSIVGEGIDATSLDQIISTGYMQTIPVDPDGVTEYRVGVDDVYNPTHIIVCTDQIENTTVYPASTYPNGMFCQSN